MKTVFLVLDFLIPSFFFLLGLCLKGRLRRTVIKESTVCFFAALLFGPIAAHFFSLPVQGMVCAGILLAQGVLLCISIYKTEYQMNQK